MSSLLSSSQSNSITELGKKFFYKSYESMKIYYELVYEDGMTHSSYNYEIMESIWNQDRDLISYLRMKFV